MSFDIPISFQQSHHPCLLPYATRIYCRAQSSLSVKFARLESNFAHSCYVIQYPDKFQIIPPSPFVTYATRIYCCVCKVPKLCPFIAALARRLFFCLPPFT